jgi:hypothetical protein
MGFMGTTDGRDCFDEVVAFYKKRIRELEDEVTELKGIIAGLKDVISGKTFSFEEMEKAIERGNK